MTPSPLLPKLEALTINKNVFGWGPSDIPTEFKNMPYQPFSKETRIGKIADWSGNVYQDMKSKNRYMSHFGGGSQYAYHHDDDDTNFQTAGTLKPKLAPHLRNRQRMMIQRKQRGGMPYNPRQLNSYQQQQQVQLQNKMRQNIPAWKKNNMRHHDTRTKTIRVIREPLIHIKDHWPAVDEVDLSRLATLSLPNVQRPVDLADFGELGYFDPSLDRVNTKDEQPLSGDLTLFYLSLLQDSVIADLIKERLGNVFMSSQVASFLMCAPRSVYSWDLVAYREEDSILIDFRDNYEDINIELMTMNENATEPPPDHLAKVYNLEGVLCTHQFRKRVLQSHAKAPRYNFPSLIPDLDDDEDGKKQSQSLGYRYRLFDIGKNIQVVIRCEVDAAVAVEGRKNETKFACVYALTEFPTKAPGAVDWRSKLDTQAGAVLASELRNNSFKLARFTTRAILSGAEFIKLGFISRDNPKDTNKHSILDVQQFKTPEFAQQMGYNVDNAWGILRCIIEHLFNMPVGCYLIQKDANKPILRFHTLPSSDFLEEDNAADLDEEQMKEYLDKQKEDAQERWMKVNEALGKKKLGTVNVNP
ncbi:Eukaryotic translation initiation factor 3 subunit D [Cichlidogyrus casuarinus]|uniref:Eukaryotic translation initiation factor 3 subunit D n=1 Tax=Cichlidogyrus casuarinus TaxID=1844966 RepID=A0ABD2QBH9_9PLAT